jgi:hypothetical protein
VSLFDGEAAYCETMPTVYFDGASSRRRIVCLVLNDRLEIREEGEPPVLWTYDDIRQSDSPAGMLRVSCKSAPPLARLEIRDTSLAAALAARCRRLGENRTDGRAVVRIVGWSLAAVVSIVMVVLFAIPYAADRLAPVVPEAFERRLGEASDVQIKALFGRRVCTNAAGQAAFTKMLTLLRGAAGLELTAVQSSVLDTKVPNAFALPGGKVYLFNGLLAKAQNPDEIAGVLAHELGHLKHRDNMRGLIYNGGTSFLIGLLFGDVTGSGALVFASRSLVTASHSREAEEGADSFAIDVMHKLGRSPKPMGELLFRVTGKEENSLSILASHPLTEDRLKRMTAEDRPPSGPPLLTDKEWAALKGICGGTAKK